MYLIDKITKMPTLTNQIGGVKATTFKAIGWQERRDLQECIVKLPEILCEDLLIIQKEFDGFVHTRDRLDLLALDKQGNLVIIENKLDNSGKEVSLQALRYVSYLRKITACQIIQIFQQYLDKYIKGQNAETLLLHYFSVQNVECLKLNGSNPRIILVAREFRPEVFSFVDLLVYKGVDTKCVKITPYTAGSDILLDSQVVDPLAYLAQFSSLVRSGVNRQTEANKLRNDFWQWFAPQFAKHNPFFTDISVEFHKEDWLKRIINGVHIGFMAKPKYVAVYVLMEKDLAFNEKVFNYFFQHKSQIQRTFGEPLMWNCNPTFKTRSIQLMAEHLHLDIKSQWNEIRDYLIEKMLKLIETFMPYIEKVKKL